MDRRLAVLFLLLLASIGSVQASNCLESIPSDLLPIFMEETAHVPSWRDAICAQIKAESAFDTNAESFYKVDGVPCCVGLGQFALPTWNQVAPTVGCVGVDRRDARCNIRVTVKYMSNLLRSRFCGRDVYEPWEVSRACYNAGMGWRRKFVV